MEVLESLRRFFKDFNGEKGVYGYSYIGRPLYYFEVKKTERPLIILQCSIHAREFITARFCLEEIKDFIAFAEVGRAVFIPCANPDGVYIARHFNPLYKANANGVDLNVNFDARWGTGEKNVKTRGAENYIGEYPFSEPESKALKEFTEKLSPDMTVSYHTKGEEIYYRFYQDGEREERDFYLAELASGFTGYKIGNAGASAGGYKDWCVEKLKTPALTIEAGADNYSHPLNTDSALNDIIEKNKGITRTLIKGLIDYERKVYESRDKRSDKGKRT